MTKNVAFRLILVIYASSFVLAQINLVEQSKSVCNGNSTIMSCGSNETVLVNRVIDGVRAVNNGQCQYTPGDCFKNSIYVCNVESNCVVQFVTIEGIPQCGNRKPDYRTINYYCVKRVHPVIYDICTTTILSDPSGAIQSPDYPYYEAQSRVCSTKIKVPPGKTINFYVYDLHIKARNNTVCQDYLEIKDSYEQYRLCGLDITAISRVFCSNEIEITYRAFDAGSFLWKGFILYYETIDLNENCSNATASSSTETGFQTSSSSYTDTEWIDTTSLTALTDLTTASTDTITELSDTTFSTSFIISQISTTISTSPNTVTDWTDSTSSETISSTQSSLFTTSTTFYTTDSTSSSTFTNQQTSTSSETISSTQSSLFTTSTTFYTVTDWTNSTFLTTQTTDNASVLSSSVSTTINSTTTNDFVISSTITSDKEDKTNLWLIIGLGILGLLILFILLIILILCLKKRNKKQKYQSTHSQDRENCIRNTNINIQLNNLK